MKILKKITLVVSITLVLVIICIFRPYERVDHSTVATELNKLGDTAYINELAYLMDGGSLLFEVKNENGERVVFFMSARMGGGEPYKDVFIGGYDIDNGAKLVKNSYQTRLRLLELLRDFDMDGDVGRVKDSAIAISSGRLSDSFRVFRNRFLFNKYDRP